jgi:hypothetical protein
MASAHRGQPDLTRLKRRSITMFWILALALVAVLAVIVVGFVVHLLFSPWLLVLAVAVVAWMKFRPRGSQR